MLTGSLIASITISLLHRPEIVTAEIPIMRKNISKFSSIFFTLNGRISTKRKIIDRPVVTGSTGFGGIECITALTCLIKKFF